MKTAEEIEHKLRIHIETTEECLENFNLDKTTIEILNQELELLKYVHEYFTSHPTHTLPSDDEIRSVRNTFVTPQEKLAFNSGLNIASARIAEMERELQEAKNLVRSITEFADGMKVLDGEALRVLKNTARRVLSDKPIQLPRK